MRWGLVILLAAATAHADVKHEAAKLFEEGRALAGKAQFDEACDRFTKSNELDRAAGTEMNLGDCHEHLGHLAEAWRWFTDAAALFEDAKDNRVDYAKKRADLLEPRLGTIIIRLEHPDRMTLTIAGRKVKSQKKIRERVDPGDIEVKGESLTNGTYGKTFHLVAGETKTLRPEGGPGPEQPEPDPGSEPTTETESEPHRGMWRGVFIGAAVVAVAGVGVFYYGHHQIDDAKDKLCQGGAYRNMPNCQFPVTLSQPELNTLNAQGDQGRTIAIAGEITFALGIAAAAVAGYEGFFAHSSVAVAPSPGGATAAVSFTW